MKKLINCMVNVCIIVSMIIPMGFSGNSQTNVKSASNIPETTPTGLFRTTIQLGQAYDLTRLSKLDVIVLAQEGNQVDLLVTELQLESLSRLGFEPNATNDIGILVNASADTYPWLVNALKDNLDQASILTAQNQMTDGISTLENDEIMLSLIETLSDEVLSSIQALPGVDNDADGLTDTQESWWCTDPNNPDSDSDGHSDEYEIQAVKDWMANRRAVAPGETPWASWPFNPLTCPDKDYDSIPNLAERWELGLNMDLESTDRDKFDDGQEVFGVTYCPGGDYSCGYGDLPRSSDAGYVGQVMPAWVKAPGNHPFVAAFPLPNVQMIQSSIVVEIVTEITTDHVISEGTQVDYSTSHLVGKSESKSKTKSWNNWEEVSEYEYENETQEEYADHINRQDPFVLLGAAVDLITIGQAIAEQEVKHQEFMERLLGPYNITKSSSYNPNMTPLDIDSMDIPKDSLPTINNYCVQGTTGCISGNGFLSYPRASSNDFDQAYQISLQNNDTQTQDRIINGSDGKTSLLLQSETGEENLKLIPNQSVTNFFDINPTINKIETKGKSWGGAKTVTTTSYSEDTVTSGNALSSEESWGTATAIDSSHAADMWFSYEITNIGTDYAREINNVAFNIYLDDNPIPIATYFVGPDIGGDGMFHNFEPGESHTFTSQHISISLEQLKKIDLGGTLRVKLEDLSFGSDELFYQNIILSNIHLAFEDGIEDESESIEVFFTPVFEGDTVTDTLSRYFPHKVDIEGDLTAIWTPEYLEVVPEWCIESNIVGSGSNQIIWCKHSLTTADWWNIYTSNLGDGSIPLQETPGVSGSTVLFRFNKDSDLDGYSDRSEDRFGTNNNDPLDFPYPELIAGLHSNQSDNKVTSTLSLLNTGLYDAFGVEAVMIAPNDSITIINNTVGGSGRVNAGKNIVVGSQIFAPQLNDITWTGTAEPVSGGYFTGVSDLNYTFTVSCANPGGCVVGQDNWALGWTDGTDTGSLAFSSAYKSPNPINIGANGLQIALISGNVFNGNTFTVEARPPSDTFQYTINYEPYTEPLVVLSYNDPQTNHRFIIPTNAMNLTSPSVDLITFSGQMLDFHGVEIRSTKTFTPGLNEIDVVVDNPTEKIIQDGYVFLNFVDPEGTLVSEIPTSYDFSPGPNVLNIAWDTSNFIPAYDPNQDYIIMAFWTDNKGNIIDIYSRTLAGLNEDPTPEFAITPADETWDFGTTQQGTILKREFSFANTGERSLLTYVDAPTGLLVSQTGSKLIGPADMATYEITLNTNDLPVGIYSDLITIHTSDLANPTRTITITGSITAGEASLPALLNRLPLDYAVTVPAPQSLGNWYSFTHPLGPTPQTIHPVKVYSSDYSVLKGMGKYAYDFSTGSGGFNLFGDGRNGDFLVATGETKQIPNTRTNVTASGTTANVSSSTGFAVGDLVLLHQTQGTSNVGKWEYNFIASISGTTWTLTSVLTNTYSSSAAKAQVIKVPQYNDVTVQSGGTLNTPAWNGSTGGIMVFVANGTVSIAGTVTASGVGYRRGDRGEYLDPVKSQGWQGESTGLGTLQSRAANIGGGGGGEGDDDSSCGAESCAAAGGGGAGYGTTGTSGQSTTGILAGLGGSIYGSASLSTTAYLGSGGGGGGADGDESTRYGGYGGAGGGLIMLSGHQITITGSVTSNGNNGLSGATINDARTGGGGGGSGGAVLITGSNVNVGTLKTIAIGGTGGSGINGGGKGGNGGLGRIYVQYCDSYSGTTNPAGATAQITCHIAEQVETSPYTTTRLQMPESFSTPKTYAIKYGRRLVFSSAGSQTTALRLPAGYLKSAYLDTLISNAGIGDLTISMDIGNDGSTDYTWTDSVNNLISFDDKDFTTAYNNWWSASSRLLSGEVDVPVKITMSKAAQILLTDVKISTYGSTLNYLKMMSGSYSDVILSIKATGTTAPLSLGIDVGDNGTIDQLVNITTPSNPHNLTSANLAAQVNTYLAGKTGLVDVPIRLFMYNATGADIINFNASIAGEKDISLLVSDIVLPITQPIETELVPIIASFHSNGNLPSGNFTAGFFASTPDVGEWYIGSALIPSVLPGQSATAEILWNTSGFTGLTTVRVFADPFDHIQETSEENNQTVGQIYVRTRPDLFATAITPSDSEPKLGESIQLTIPQKNFGETDAVLSALALYDGNPVEGGTLIGEQSAGMISGSETSFAFDWQPLTTGWHRLYAKPDLNDVVDEFDEDNNLTWQDIYVGLAGPLMLDSGTASDPVYTEENGFGYIDINLPDQISSCGLGNLAEETIRRDPDGTVLYQFDHLLPGHFYHLDITIYECDGAGRQEYILIDDNQIAGPEDLGDGQVHRLSLRLDPAFYTDRSITVAIQADGIDGAVVSEVNLHDIDYRYADAGGGDDPQYPGNEAFGWLDGDAITTWGLLPYQSVRVDQIDSELRYQFDNLNPDKRYNVHFTFWQPSGTGRVMKVQVDGLDTGLTVNTGDYLKHQEKISIPVNAYSTDGSVVINIVRTNASTGAMVNEIALEEETIAVNTGCFVQETPYFSETYGTVLIEDLNAPLGSVIQALSPRGDTVGCFTVTSEGNYGFMRIYGEDTSESPIIPGMRAGEMVEYRVNGAPAISSPLIYWNDDHASHRIDLNAGNITSQSILLNTGWNLISFNLEPPTPLVSTVLNSIDERYSRVLGEYGIYVPTLPDEFNTLQELHAAIGYYVRVTGTTSVSLLVEGISHDCSTPKQLHAGWNWIGSPCETIETATALQSIAGYYQRVLSLDKTYDPALPQFSTLLNLKPGEGYLIYITDPVTLVYPSQNILVAEESSLRQTTCQESIPTPNLTLVYGQISFGNVPAPKGSLVEFVTPRNEIAGCARLLDDGILPLTHVFGAIEDDGGYLQGEPITARIYGQNITIQPDLIWSDDKAPHLIEMSIPGWNYYLPIIIK